VKMASDPYGKSPTATMPAPTFSYRVLSDEAGPVIPDPVTGVIVPGKTVLKTYRLEGNVVRRVIAPGAPAGGEAHPEKTVERKKNEDKKPARRKRR
ncbi:MAG: SH3 domain-containing protein, partial [Edaphobacter sp.]